MEAHNLHKQFADTAGAELWLLRVSVTIGVPRILQWRGFTWWGRTRESGDGSSQWDLSCYWGISSPGPLPGAWGRNPPEAEAKCEIRVHFLRFAAETLGFNEYRSRVWTVYFATQFEKIMKMKWGRLSPLTLPPSSGCATVGNSKLRLTALPVLFPSLCTPFILTHALIALPAKPTRAAADVTPTLIGVLSRAEWQTAEVLNYELQRPHSAILLTHSRILFCHPILSEIGLQSGYYYLGLE